MGAHSGMLLPCSRTLVSIVDTLTNYGPTQVTSRLERMVIQDFELFVSRFCWQERPSGLSQLQRSWSTSDLVSWRRSIIGLKQYSNPGCQMIIYYTQANLLEVLDVFGALGIEVTEGQLRIENSSSNVGSRQFLANHGENMRTPKKSAASEVLNIVSGPGIQVKADVLCSENGSSIACSRPHLGVLDLGLGVQSEAISSDTKGNTKEMKTGGKIYCPLYFPFC